MSTKFGPSPWFSSNFAADVYESDPDSENPMGQTSTEKW